MPGSTSCTSPKINALETSYTYYGSPLKRELPAGRRWRASILGNTDVFPPPSVAQEARAEQHLAEGDEAARAHLDGVQERLEGVDRSRRCEEGPPSLGRRRPSLSRLARPAGRRLVRRVLPRAARDHGGRTASQLTVGFGDIAFAWTTSRTSRYLWDPLYGRIFWRTFQLAAITTLGTLLVGFPLAYYIARYAKRKTLLLLLVIVPFWTSFLIRTYSWLVILDPDFFLWRCARRSATSRSSTRRRRSTSASSTTTCPSWCCRCTRRSSGWTGRSWRRPRTSGTAPFGPSAA